MTMTKRLRVTDVTPGGLAELSGILAGDILEEFNGIQMTSNTALDKAIGSNRNSAPMVLFRNGEKEHISVKSGRLGLMVADEDFDSEAYCAEYVAFRLLRAMIVTTAPTVEGFKITKTIDVISAECVLGLSAIDDLFASARDFFGGRSKTLQEALRSARRNCLEELKKEALSLGANAVIGVDLDYSEFSGQGKSMLFLVASGTAVVIEGA